MKLSILAAFIAAAVAGEAAPQSYVDSSRMTWIHRDESGDYMRLTNKPCENPAILARIQPQFHKDFRAAELFVKGKPGVSICYDAVDMPGGQVHIAGEKGDLQLPMDLFTLESGT